jgi:hypothetical protein
MRPVVSVKPWFTDQVEKRSFVTTISRVMFGHCSIRAHLDRFRIVGDPICLCMMNYETVDYIIWECSRFEVERRQLLFGLATVNVVGFIGQEKADRLSPKVITLQSHLKHSSLTFPFISLLIVTILIISLVVDNLDNRLSSLPKYDYSCYTVNTALYSIVLT